MRPDLVYNIVSGRLTGRIDGRRFDVAAGSGGRAGSTTLGAIDWRLQNNALATHVGGRRSAGTHHFGPVPTGHYTLKIHEKKPNWIRLIPDSRNVMHNREGFAIHRRGPTGSHGCIVPSDPSTVLQLVVLLKAREERGADAPTLDVIAVGTDLDQKFRAV